MMFNFRRFWGSSRGRRSRRACVASVGLRRLARGAARCRGVGADADLLQELDPGVHGHGRLPANAGDRSVRVPLAAAVAFARWVLVAGPAGLKCPQIKRLETTLISLTQTGEGLFQTFVFNSSRRSRGASRP